MPEADVAQLEALQQAWEAHSQSFELLAARLKAPDEQSAGDADADIPIEATRDEHDSADGEQ